MFSSSFCAVLSCFLFKMFLKFNLPLYTAIPAAAIPAAIVAPSMIFAAFDFCLCTGESKGVFGFVCLKD